MIELNLTTKGAEQIAIKEYLQNNASDTLAEKINNGVLIIKDGIPLINKKNLDGFMKYACDEAKKLAEKGATSACVHSDTVFNWAIHYFEEDSIEGIIYNQDGTEYKQPKTKYEQKTTSTTTIKPQIKPQPTLFDLMENTNVKNIESYESVNKDEALIEEQQEIMEDISSQEPEKNTLDLITNNEKPKGSPIYQRYIQLQEQYPNFIIAMRLGDFYEVFGEGATLLAKDLDLTLTGRDCGLENRVPMVGFPYHVADNYFNKICEKHKMVVAENTEDIKIYTKENVYIDYETGEYLTEEEMRKFDGDIEEPKELFNNPIKNINSTLSNNNVNLYSKLSELFGNILIVR